MNAPPQVHKAQAPPQTLGSAPGRSSLARKSRSAAVGTSSAHSVPSLVYNVLRNPGQPLDQPTRAFMEPRFGHDFRKVRVHTDLEASESAAAVNARAYTVGRHIVFAARQYVPDTRAGRELLAHELTHVLQQGTDEASPLTLSLGQPADRYEEEADRWSSSIAGLPSELDVGRAVSRGAALHDPSTSGVIQRKVPTGISLKETHPLGHGNLKDEADKKKFLTYIADVSLMQLTPPGDYTEGQKKGDCTKEFLTEVSNTCPGSEPFCKGDKCFQVNLYQKPIGDALTGTQIADGPDTFVDFHRARYPSSLLDGTGQKVCSVVCHQLYKYRTASDAKYHELGAFYIIRNFKAEKFTPSDSKTPLQITSGDIRKVPAGSSVPTKEGFAKTVAPGLVKSGALLDAPLVPKAQATPKK